MRWRTTVLAVACVGGVGCFDFGSVSGGSPPDAGPTGAVDGAASSDAGVDGAPTGASPGGFCASLTPKPTFCDDFDEYEASTTSPTWDQTIANDGVVRLDDLHAFPVSKFGLTAQTSVAASGVYPEADLIKALYPKNGFALRIEFEMNVEQWDTTRTSAQIIAAEVIFKNPVQFNQIVLNLNSLGAGGVSAQLAENAQAADGGQGGYSFSPLPDHPPTGKWVKVEMTLNVQSRTGTQSDTVTVKLDGVTEIDAQLLKVALEGGAPFVHLGIGSVRTPSDAWSMHYDNFVADVTPF